MKWNERISNNDSIINNLTIEGDDIVLEIALWDGKLIELMFINYFILKEKKAIGEGIGDILVQSQSQLLDELRTDIINGGGSKQEIEKIKSYVFYDAWNERIILEILSEDLLSYYK